MACSTDFELEVPVLKPVKGGRVLPDDTVNYVYFQLQVTVLKPVKGGRVLPDDAVNSWVLCLFSTTHCNLLKLIVRSGLDVPTFATRHLHACHQARAPSGGRWNCGREMSGNFA
jgi:hypothetical protein